MQVDRFERAAPLRRRVGTDVSGAPMIEILVTALPIYLLILIGYAAVRTGYFAPALIGALSQFALKVALIALIFGAVALPRGEGGLNAAFLGAYLGGSVATMLVGFGFSRLVLRQPAADSWILSLGMSNSNSGYLGFPIASLFFGADAAVVFAMTIIVENAFTLPFPVVAASASGHRGNLAGLMRQAGRRIATNPLIIAVTLALMVRLSGLPIGAPIARTVSLLAAAASPVALVVVGGTVATMSVRGHWRRTAAVTIGKLGLHPLMVAAALMLVPGVPPALIPVGILFAAVPMITIYPILAAPFGLAAVSSTALLVSTSVSLVTVSLVLSRLIGL